MQDVSGSAACEACEAAEVRATLTGESTVFFERCERELFQFTSS